MKKLYMAAAALLILSACGGTKDYDNYVATLAAQTAAIDTITSTRGYASYIDSLQALTAGFDALGLKLDPTQRDEIESLGLKISAALDSKYRSLTTAPQEATTPQEASDTAAIPTSAKSPSSTAE